MTKSNKNSDIYRWVTQGPTLAEINISNLRSVTETKYNYNLLYQTESITATPKMFISGDHFTKLNPYYIFGKISYHLVNSPDKEFITSLTVAEERFICNKLEIPYVDSWLHGGMIPSIEKHFKVIGINKLNMQLYWNSALYVNPKGDIILIANSPQTESLIKNTILNKGLLDE